MTNSATTNLTNNKSARTIKIKFVNYPFKRTFKRRVKDKFARRKNGIIGSNINKLTKRGKTNITINKRKVGKCIRPSITNPNYSNANSRLYPIQGVNSLKNSGITPTNRNSPPSNASQPKRWLSDLSTAKDLANVVSPSPYSVPSGRDSYFRPKSPQEKERERRLENGRKERGRIEFNNRKFGSVFKH